MRAACGSEHRPRPCEGRVSARLIATRDVEDARIAVQLDPENGLAAARFGQLLAYSDDFDVVCGTRTATLMIREGSEMTFFTRWPNVIYAKCIELLFNTANLTDVGCIYRLMKKDAWKSIEHLEMDGGWAFNLDWMLHIARRRMRFVEIPVNFFPRTGEAVEVEKKYVPFFKAGKDLRDRLNTEG